MIVVAVIPLKNLAEAKSRLAPLLQDCERRGLVRAMLHDVLAALKGASGLSGIFVVADEPQSLPPGVSLIRESVNRGYDAAVATALADRRVAAADAMLVLPADLPRLQSMHIDSFLHDCSKPQVRIAPARDEDGTNALLIAPPDAISTAFGPGSFKRHYNAVVYEGIALVTVNSPGLAFDVDTPHDLIDFCSRDGDSASLAYLRRSGVADRLRRPE